MLSRSNGCATPTPWTVATIDMLNATVRRGCAWKTSRSKFPALNRLVSELRRGYARSFDENTMNAIGQPNTISTMYAGPPSGRRFDAWRDEVSRGFCRLDVQPSEGAHIICRTQIVSLSSVALASPTGTSAQFVRTPNLLSDGNDDFVLVTAASGRVLVTQNGPIELLESQMCLIEMCAPGAVALDNAGRFTTARIPRRELLRICPNAEDRLCEPLLENGALRKTFARYFTLASEVAANLDIVEQHVTAQHLVDMVGLLLRTGPDESELARQRGLSAAQLHLVQNEALKNLSDDTLTIELLARRCGVSLRQVQRLFERAGATFTEFLLEQRLLLARKMLLAPGNRHSKISAIASDAGFGDLSYFNRVFRRRFSTTPSELRNSGCLSDYQSS